MLISEQIFRLVILSIVVSSVAWTVTQEEIFSEWQEICKKRSESGRTIFERKFFYVFTCEYCFSHWTTLLVLFLTGFQLLLDDWRGYILSFFAIPWVANQFMSFYRRLRVDIKLEDVKAELAELKKNEEEGQIGA